MRKRLQPFINRDFPDIISYSPEDYLIEILPIRTGKLYN